MLLPTSALNASSNTRVRTSFAALAFFAFITLVPAVYGQADLTFSGGSGTPLTTTLTRSVRYAVNNTNCSVNGPMFVFDEVGLNSGFQVASGTMVFSIDGGSAQPINYLNFGLIPNDMFMFGDRNGLGNDAVVVLSLGSITTNAGISAAPPANGSFTTYLTNDSAVRCSADGVAIDPSAAGVSIGGRVIVENGLGLRNAQVSLTDAEGNLRQTVTSSFGYYRFDQVAAGETVFLAVRSKRYTFAPRVLTVEDSISDFDFIAGK